MNTSSLFLPARIPSQPVLTGAMQAHLAESRALAASRAPLAALFSAHSVTCGGITLPYRLYTPETEPGKRYPLVLFLHGGGECGTDNEAQLLASDGATVWVRRQQTDPAFRCFVLSPQIPAGADFWTEPQLVAVEAALRQVAESLPVDENRLYLVGKSVGGGGCWRFNAMAPARFAAVVCCAGLLGVDDGTYDAAAQGFLGKNLWLFHAEDDPVAPVEISRGLVQGLERLGRRCGKHFFYSEYPAGSGLGHRCWDAALENDLMARWMFSQDLSQPPFPENPGKPDVIPPEMMALAEKMAADRKARERYLPRFREGRHTRDGLTLRYRLFVPEAAAQGQPCPLVVFLHGVGECGVDNAAPLLASDGGLVWVKKQDAGQMEPCFVLAPQCPLPIPGLRWEPEYLSLLGEVLAGLSDRFPIDPKRIYATGLSLGGYGVWNLVKMLPGRFAAAVTCCSACVKGTLLESSMDREGLDACAEALRSVPLWLFHAEDDPAVPVEITRTMAQRLQQSGARELHVTIYPTSEHWGHACWNPAYENHEMQRWLLEQHL